MFRSGLALVLCSALLLAAPLRADQTSLALPPLFDQLAEAQTPTDAARLESRIWLAWLEPPAEEAGLTMAWVESAMRSGELDRARTLSDELVSNFPGFAEAWNKRATVRYLQDDFDGSVDDIRRTLALEPRHFGAISGLGLIFMKQGNFSAALDAFEAVLEISPASTGARLNADRVRAELEQSEI